MPNWSNVSNRLKSPEETLKSLQIHYLNLFKQYTNRNVIAYYSAFMQRPGLAGEEINDMDKMHSCKWLLAFRETNETTALI